MNELQVVSSEDRVCALNKTIFSRAYVEQMISMECFSDEIWALIEKTQEIYFEQISKGEFSVDELIDTLQSKDEEVLYQIADIIISDSELSAFYLANYKDESREDIIDVITTDYMIDEDISLFSAYPAFSKSNISYLITYSLDSAKVAYYVVDPPPGSFQEYCKEMACDVYYNDAQNMLIEELGAFDRLDDSPIFLVRKLREKTIVLEAKQ